MDDTKQKTVKNVIGMWSALKGLLVIAVILGHSVYEAEQICNIPVYPIPFRVLTKAGGIILFTFFVISGYLFNPKKKGIGKQYGKYVLIYVVAALFMTVAAVINDWITGRTNPNAGSLFLGCLYGASERMSLFGWEIQPPYALWFFAVFMNSWLILEMLTKIKKEAVRRGIIFGCPVLFFLFCIGVGRPGGLILERLPFYIVPTIIAVMLLYIGYYIKKENILFQKIKWYWWCIIIFTALGSYFFGKIDMMRNGYQLNILDCVGGICGVFVVLYWYIRLINPDNRLLDPLMWIGRRTLLIIPIHCIEWALFMWADWRKLRPLGMYGSAFLIFFLRMGIIVLSCIVIEYLQMKYKRWKQEVKKNGSYVTENH